MYSVYGTLESSFNIYFLKEVGKQNNTVTRREIIKYVFKQHQTANRKTSNHLQMMLRTVEEL